MNLATMIKQTSAAVNRSALGLAAAAVMGMGLGANADLVGRWVSGPQNLNETSGYRAAGTHDGVAIGNTGALAYSADVPAGFAGRSLDLTAGNVGVMVANSSTADAGYMDTYDGVIANQLTVAFWAKGFPGEWAPWVSKYGENGLGWQLRRFAGDPFACFTLRGLDNADGGGSSINVNDSPAKWHHFAGVWDQATGTRKLYVDGVFSHTVNNTVGQNMALTANQSLALGARSDGGTGFGSWFSGRLYDVRIYNSLLTQSEITALLMPSDPPVTPGGLTATGVAGAVDLSWAAADGAASYNVKRSPTTGSGYETIANVTGTTYADLTGTLGTPYFYVVTATNGVGETGISNEASAARLAGTAKEILTFSFGALGGASISGTNIVKNVPLGTDVTALAPTCTLSPQATTVPSSGTVIDFTTPQTYIVTAEDGTTQAYAVKVFQTASVAYDFNSGLQGWTQIWPLPSAAYPVLWVAGHLGPIYAVDYPDTDNIETRFARSPEFYLTNLGDLTFQLTGGQSSLSAPAMAPSAIPELAQNGGFAGVALRDVAADTYVLSRRKPVSGGTDALSFTAAELAPYANDGKKYTLDYIDYNKGGWGWTTLDNVSIPGTLVVPVITGMTLPPFDPATILGTNITLRVSYGLDLSALAPAYTMTPVAPFATGSPASGATVDFTSGSANYTLVSENLLVTNVFTVTIVVLPDPASALVGHWVSFAEDLVDRSVSPDGMHDGTAAGWNPGGLAYSPDTPPGFAGSSLDLTAGNVGVSINNSSTNDAGYVNTFDDGIRSQCTVAFWAKGIPGTWAPWVSKRGEDNIGWQLRRFQGDPYACFTLRGLDNSDGSGSGINVNDSPATWHHFAGVWDQAFGTRKLFVDGVLSHVNNNTIGQMMALAAGHHVALGARQSGNGVDYENFFSGLLYDVRIYNQVLFSNQVQVVMTTPAAPQAPEAKIKTFGLPGWPAVINTAARTITWIAPVGTDLTALAPTFTVSPGATCDKASGSTWDFSTPQTYRVTSSDSLVTAVYTVAIVTGYNFDDGTLQGWRNRVWDLAANEGAGGWADLEPNVTNMPLTINGGVIHPASSPYNQLFASVGGVVYPIIWATPPTGFPLDQHDNTMWLRSPEFYLNRTGDMTVQLAKGVARTGAPANEAEVPALSIQDGGWMGVVLRRVSDNAFVLIKTKAAPQGENDTYYTFTFTKAELAQYAGSKAYTLDLIISDKGGWGWVTMDNVLIPGTGTPPKIQGTLLTLQ